MTRKVDRLDFARPVADRATAGAPLVDTFRRRITYLRLSITDRCDLRCTYCMPERMTFLPKADILSLEESYLLARAFMARGVRTIRLTGGEPLVRRDAIDLVRAIGRHVGKELDEVTLTTNGTQLAAHADALARAGVRRINVSLDTRDPETFRKLSRRDVLGKVLEGIAAASEAGLKVKLNTVAMRGINDDEIPDLVAWAHTQGHAISLIETMPLGDVDEAREDRFVPLSEIRRQLDARWTLRPSDASTPGPSRYFDAIGKDGAETGGRIGFITPMSDNFCEGCNRLRVTATGQLYPCLGGGEQVDLRAALRSETPDTRVADALDMAMAIKPERHDFRIGAGEKPTQARHMSVTGG
ncbi:cyclic pyranopterin phosphate synthase [Erythrobacter lutimaris]|nr:cyclic pyranopterin phosphate synthase [Alteriqipengyuania lutimaris]